MYCLWSFGAIDGDNWSKLAAAKDQCVAADILTNFKADWPTPTANQSKRQLKSLLQHTAWVCLDIVHTICKSVVAQGVLEGPGSDCFIMFGTG